ALNVPVVVAGSAHIGVTLAIIEATVNPEANLSRFPHKHILKCAVAHPRLIKSHISNSVTVQAKAMKLYSVDARSCHAHHGAPSRTYPKPLGLLMSCAFNFHETL